MNRFKELFGDYIISTGEHLGIPWCVAMGTFTINGYIELPEGHPWIELDELHHPAGVHGGITFKKGRVQGFDTNHLGDSHHPDAPLTKAIPALEGDILKHLGYLGVPARVWEKDEVEAEVKRLAEQAAKVIPA